MERRKLMLDIDGRKRLLKLCRIIEQYCKMKRKEHGTVEISLTDFDP